MTETVPPGPQRVLVVDDSRDLAENVSEMFAHRGYRTFAAHDGDSAQRFADAENFDLAIVDVRLPAHSGVDVAAKLKARRPQAEVVLMTAHATLDTAIAAVRGGMYAYVQKPFDPDELLSLGERALSQVQLRRERGRLERELSQSEALYRSVVDAVDSFIVGLSLEGLIRMWNRSVAHATGHHAASAMNRPLADFLVSDLARARLAEALSRLSAGRNVSGLELALQTASGDQRLVRWNLRHFAGDEDRPPLILAAGEDLTDRIDLERRAAEAEAMASLGTLTAGLAHEIRNPLNAAALQLELLRRNAGRADLPALRDDVNTRVEIVREELERLTNLLDDFLDLAKPKALSMIPVDLRAVAAEAIALQEPAARGAGVSLHQEGEDEKMHALGDRHALKQVLVNLIVNAIDAMKARGHGRIDVLCHNLSDERVELSVQDDGPGIPEDITPKLFAPFVTTKEAGTGLGLTIVKRIIDRHGGALFVDSTPDEGTTVRVVLPRARAPNDDGR